MTTALLIAVALLVAVLAVPLTLRFHITMDHTLSSRLRLSWAFGLVRLSLSPATPRRMVDRENTTVSPRAHGNRATSNTVNLFSALRQRPLRQRLLRFIHAIWRAFRKRDVKLQLRIGLGDPAETGQLWALVGPLSGMLANLRDADITIEPIFIEQCFELETSGEVQVIPLQFLYLSLALLLSPVMWRGIRQAHS